MALLRGAAPSIQGSIYDVRKNTESLAFSVSVPLLTPACISTVLETKWKEEKFAETPRLTGSVEGDC